MELVKEPVLSLGHQEKGRYLDGVSFVRGSTDAQGRKQHLVSGIDRNG